MSVGLRMHACVVMNRIAVHAWSIRESISECIQVPADYLIFVMHLKPIISGRLTRYSASLLMYMLFAAVHVSAIQSVHAGATYSCI